MSRPLSQIERISPSHLAGSGRLAAESRKHSPRIIDLKENSKEPGNGRPQPRVHLN